MRRSRRGFPPFQPNVPFLSAGPDIDKGPSVRDTFAGPIIMFHLYSLAQSAGSTINYMRCPQLPCGRDWRGGQHMELVRHVLNNVDWCSEA